MPKSNQNQMGQVRPLDKDIYSWRRTGDGLVYDVSIQRSPEGRLPENRRRTWEYMNDQTYDVFSTKTEWTIPELAAAMDVKEWRVLEDLKEMRKRRLVVHDGEYWRLQR